MSAIGLACKLFQDHVIHEQKMKSSLSTQTKKRMYGLDAFLHTSETHTVARRYEFYVRVTRKHLTSERSERVRYCSYHENIKFISSCQRVL